MTVTENPVPENIQPQDKVDTNLIQPKVDTTSTQQPAETEAAEDPNWKAFREARKKDRAEREAAEKKAAEKELEVAALKAAMEAAFSRQSPPLSETTRNQYDQYVSEETEDERIEKKVQAAIAAREAAAERARIEREHQEYPHRLTQTYPDFNYMISQDNLDYLDYHFPEVSRPLQRLQDGFDKWSDIYQAIKKFVPNSTTSKREAAKAEANFNKPKSMSSASVNQPQEVGARLPQHDIEQRRAARYAEMKRIINGVG